MGSPGALTATRIRRKLPSSAWFDDVYPRMYWLPDLVRHFARDAVHFRQVVRIPDLAAGRKRQGIESALGVLGFARLIYRSASRSP